MQMLIRLFLRDDNCDIHNFRKKHINIYYLTAKFPTSSVSFLRENDFRNGSLIVKN